MNYSRKLVSIMFTDIVGYTKLMQESESSAVQIRNRHRAIIESTHQTYTGKVIQYYGDGTLSIFESAGDSVRCAIEIQRQIRVDPCIPLRIGIHLGDVLITESDIIGNGVNIASRVESLGVSGAILISNKVKEEINNQNISLRLMGSYHFKNDEYPRDIYAICEEGLTIPDSNQLSGKLQQSENPSKLAQKDGSKSTSWPDPTLKADPKSSDAQFEQDVKEIINENLADPDLSVVFLCKEIGYSRPQLYRKLQALRGQSPSDFIREVRLEKAAELLSNQSGNVSEIAYQTGFNNLSYFSKVFKVRFGSTPSEYQKENRISVSAPAALTKLVGRDSEIQDILVVLKDTRLLTLTGTGGTGKTRLALELLQRIRNTFRHGAYFVQLAPVVDHRQVMPKIAQVLKMQQDPTRETLELIIDYIGIQEILIVLDNFEHVVEASNLIYDLLLSCPNLKVVATSRIILNVAGEQEYSVPQLALPIAEKEYTVEALLQIHSVQLFVSRVKNVKSAFEINDQNKQAIANICIMLDGLPLALELAAAPMKIFSPNALLRRLRNNLDILKSNSPNQPDRHRTLRNAIDWSYSILAPEEQTLFRRLSIFSGGCTIEAAEDVCFSDYSANFDVIDVLVSLVDKSLLYREEHLDGDPRFFMLETIKSFGQDRLEKSLQKDEIATRYVNYYCRELKNSDQYLTGASQKEWLNYIDAELDNIRAVLTWFVKKNDANAGLEFAISFWRFWTIRTMMREGASWFKAVLDIPATKKDTIVRCRALNAYGVLFTLTRRILNALSIFEQSLEMARTLNYKEGVAQALKFISWINYFQCRFSLFEKHSKEALEILQSLDNTRDIASIYNNMGNTCRLKGELEESLSYHEKAAGIMTQIGDERGYAYNLCGQAWNLCFVGKYDESSQKLEKALNILTAIDDKQLIGFGKSVLAFNLCYMASFDRSAELSKFARPMWEQSGNEYGEVMCDLIDSMLNLKTGQLAMNDQLFSSQAKGFSESIDKSIYLWKNQIWARNMIMQGQLAEAFSLVRENIRVLISHQVGLILPDELEIMAFLLIKKRSAEDAIVLFSFAQELRSLNKIVVPPIWKQDHDLVIALLKESVSSARFDELAIEGKKSTIASILDRALSE